ncbi:MAG: mannitol-1-phosphate 5-dehydrogenase [Spirochaetaceae bacterium]|jgi:mannitol-1-phosphate 5-dehydrogenase|nr:mannitol-1-phosphate 5-dehydrogenase [Spirochaetaceae bacterium]
MKAVHFGAGNIGRGFIGEVLHKNGFTVDFVDVNETIIDALRKRGGYEICLAGEKAEHISISGVNGINSKKEPEAVVKAVSNADIVTTAIGPGILPFIAEITAQGIIARKLRGITAPLDIIACENMIGGSAFLRKEVVKYIPQTDISYFDTYIGFPNAAVDRIVPVQKNDDPLFVSVEPFREWVIDEPARKAKHITLREVEYAKDLQPFIERKLFSVNTGHASAAYTGHHYGWKFIGEAMRDERVLSRLQDTLAETGSLLCAKWNFDKETHQKYTRKIIARFSNPAINDEIKRVARNPIRKLGFDERFIRPVRELKERGLSYKTLLSTISLVLKYDMPDDEESARLQQLLKETDVPGVIKSVTGLTDAALIAEIAAEWDAV